jgi:hypothetical protein
MSETTYYVFELIPGCTPLEVLNTGSFERAKKAADAQVWAFCNPCVVTDQRNTTTPLYTVRDGSAYRSTQKRS